MVDVEPAFVADGEASKLVEPCEGSLDDPAVAAKLLAGVDPSAGDARPDLAAATCVAAAAMVIRSEGERAPAPHLRVTQRAQTWRNASKAKPSVNSPTTIKEPPNLSRWSWAGRGIVSTTAVSAAPIRRAVMHNAQISIYMIS